MHMLQICYPKPTDKPLFNGLVKQCKNLGIPFLTEEEIAGPGASPLSDRFQIVMDAIFGFSFRGAPRPPFDRILTKLIELQDSLPIVSVDIPSGWDVEKGDQSGQGLKPDMLVSLTTPKRCDGIPLSCSAGALTIITNSATVSFDTMTSIHNSERASFYGPCSS